MAEKAKTRKEQRAESDARIIVSAIKSFGQVGYTNSTMVEIAQGAGVTGGLLVQRFETKEKLFMTAYQTVMNKYISNPDYSESLTKSLISLLDEIKELKKTDVDAFAFLKTVLNSSDLPDGYVTVKRELFEKRYIYKRIVEAQKKGLVPKGDCFNLLQAFLVQAFNQVDICNKYDVPCPEDDYFLRIIRFTDEEKIRINKQKEAIHDSLCKTFDILIYVDVEHNTSEIMRQPQFLEKYSFHEDAVEGAKIFIDTSVAKEDKEKVREYLDFSTLDERMKGRKVLVECIRSVNGELYLHSLIPVRTSKEGKITELLAGMQLIEKEFK